MAGFAVLGRVVWVASGEQCCVVAGAAPLPPLQSVRDPHAAQQHVCVDAGVCGRRARHHGEEPQHPGGQRAEAELV